MRIATLLCRALVGVSGVALVAACGAGGDEAGAGASDTIRLGVSDLQGLEELQRNFAGFVEIFEEESGLDVDYFPVNDRVAATAALSSGTVDIVYTGPAEYVVMRERTDAEPIVGLRFPNYQSCIYTNTESGVKDLDDLRGGKVAMTDIGSTSGHLGPSQILVDAGIDPLEDLEVLTIGDTVHQALKRGDVGAVGTTCLTYERNVAEEDDPSDFFVLAEGELLPPNVFVSRAGLDPGIVDTFRTTLEENFDELVAAMIEAGERYVGYEGSELLEVDDADFDVVRSMYRAIGVDDFSEFVG